MKRAAFGKAAELRVGAEQLRWVKAQRDGGATPQEYAEALLQHPNPKAGGAKVPLEGSGPHAAQLWRCDSRRTSFPPRTTLNWRRIVVSKLSWTRDPETRWRCLLATSWAILAPSLGHLEPMLGNLGSILAPSWAIRGDFYTTFQHFVAKIAFSRGECASAWVP